MGPSQVYTVTDPAPSLNFMDGYGDVVFATRGDSVLEKRSAVDGSLLDTLVIPGESLRSVVYLDGWVYVLAKGLRCEIYKVDTNLSSYSTLTVLGSYDSISMSAGRHHLWISGNNATTSPSNLMCFNQYGEEVFQQWIGTYSNYLLPLADKLYFLLTRDSSRIVAYELPAPQKKRYALPQWLPKPTLKVSGLLPVPSPFDPTKGPLTIRFNLSGEAEVEVLVYAVSEKLVRRLRVRGRPGVNFVRWDGRNEKGHLVANGVYVVRVIARGDGGSASAMTKLIVRRAR